jgi:hypothetical protein
MGFRPTQLRESLPQIAAGGILGGALGAGVEGLFLGDIFWWLTCTIAGAAAGLAFALASYWMDREGWTLFFAGVIASGVAGWTAWLIAGIEVHHAVVISAAALVQVWLAVPEIRPEETRSDEPVPSPPDSSGHRAALSAQLDESIRRGRS